jgi:hypothetical protein
VVPRRVLSPLVWLVSLPGRVLRRFGVRTRLRDDRLGEVAHWALLVAGLGIGILLAFPVRDISGKCPTGEGFGWCALQKQWLPAVLLLVAPILGAHLLSGLLLIRVPKVWERLRRGERPVKMTARQEAPPYDRDPFLLASTWGVKTGRDRSARRRLPRLRRR